MICKGDNVELVDSGIAWIGAVPAKWNIFPAGGVFCEVKEKNTDGKYNNPFSFRYGEIVNKKITGEIDESIGETLNAYRVVAPDTIIINGLNLNYDFISQRVAIVRDNGIITSAYLAVKPDKNKVVPRFALYLLKAYDYRQVFHGLGSGIRKTLKYQDFKNIKVVAPSLTEQEAIVSYLDFQCKQIDSIISDAKASIEEYKSWKASIIYEAVTKGLDPNVEMKDSGVEWIGKIPSNWTTKSIKYIMQESKERTATGTEEMLSVTQKYGIIKSSDATISNPSTSTEDWRIVHIGDIVFNKYKAHSGVFFVSPLEGIVTFNYCVYRCFPDNCAKYFEYQFKTPRCIGEFITHMKGVGDSISPLYTTELYKIKVIVPPLEEQLRIVEYLNIQCPRIDEIISEKESLVADLESYKKSLIFEVVTGKRRVV